MHIVSLLGGITGIISLGAAFVAFASKPDEEKRWRKVLRVAFGVVASIGIIPGIYMVNLGSRMAQADIQEMLAIRTEIAALPLGEQERTYFLKRLDPKPSGGIFGGYEEATIVDARATLQEARAAKQAKK